MIHFKNAQVITMQREGDTAAAFSVVDGRFQNIYRVSPSSQSSGPSPDQGIDQVVEQMIDLKGAIVIPGIVESHGHIIWTGLMGSRLDLRAAPSFADVCRLVGTYAQAHPDSEWIIGEGWDQNQWGDCTAGAGVAGKLAGGITLTDAQVAQLSDAAPQHKVYLTRVDGHVALVNAAALVVAGVSSQTSVPTGGLIGQTPSGSLSGLLLDAAMQLVSKHIPAPRPEDIEAALSLALGQMARHGVTSFHECGASGSEIELFERFRTTERLTCRMHVMVDGTREDLREDWLRKGPQMLSSDGTLQIRAIKMFADGALGSRGALLSRPYDDEPSTCGIEIASKLLLEDTAKRSLKRGFQMATHAIGDRACSNVLDAYEVAEQSEGQLALAAGRFRIEHAQMMKDSDVKRMARLSVIGAVQCIHCLDDAPFVRSRIGPERLEGMAYRWKSLLQAGVRLTNGSDTPVVPSRPFLGMQAATAGGSADRERERLTSYEALEAMTVGGAYAAFMEAVTGSIEAGKFADFVVLDRNPLQCSNEELAEVKVIETWMNGKKIYSDGDL